MFFFKRSWCSTDNQDSRGEYQRKGKENVTSFTLGSALCCFYFIACWGESHSHMSLLFNRSKKKNWATTSLISIWSIRNKKMPEVVWVKQWDLLRSGNFIIATTGTIHGEWFQQDNDVRWTQNGRLLAHFARRKPHPSPPRASRTPRSLFLSRASI